MKNLWHKINRGVILSIVIILAIAVYYGAVAIRISPDKAFMGETLDGLFTEYEKTFLLDDQLVSANLTTEQAQLLLDDMVDSFKPYFATVEAAKAFVTDMVAYDFTEQIVTKSQRYTEYAINLSRISDLKVDYKEKTATLTAKTRKSYLYTYYEYVYDTAGNVTGTNSTEQSSDNESYSYSVGMVKVGEKWLVSSVIDSGYGGYADYLY